MCVIENEKKSKKATYDIYFWSIYMTDLLHIYTFALHISPHSLFKLRISHTFPMRTEKCMKSVLFAMCTKNGMQQAMRFPESQPERNRIAHGILPFLFYLFLQFWTSTSFYLVYSDTVDSDNTEKWLSYVQKQIFEIISASATCVGNFLPPWTRGKTLSFTVCKFLSCNQDE